MRILCNDMRRYDECTKAVSREALAITLQEKALTEARGRLSLLQNELAIQLELIVRKNVPSRDVEPEDAMPTF
jgi:hypothetical protein